MLQEIYYVSGNAGKQQEVRDFFAQNLPEIELKICAIDLVEIQSLDQQEIALDKARQAWQLLKRPLLLDDAGFYFKQYDRFPGTLCKFVYESIGFAGLTRLYTEDDPASFDLTLVFMHGPDSFESFQVSTPGTLVAPFDMQHSSVPYLKIFKPEGCTRTLFELKQVGLDQPYNSRIRALEKFKKWYENSAQLLPSNQTAKRDQNLLK